MIQYPIPESVFSITILVLGFLLLPILFRPTSVKILSSTSMQIAINHSKPEVIEKQDEKCYMQSANIQVIFEQNLFCKLK